MLGILPVKRFEVKEIAKGKRKLPRRWGIVPVNKFRNKSNTNRCDSFPSSEGILWLQDGFKLEKCLTRGEILLEGTYRAGKEVRIQIEVE